MTSFTTDEPFRFSVVCFHFGSAAAGYYAVVPESDDLDWYNTEVIGWEDEEMRRRR